MKRVRDSKPTAGHERNDQPPSNPPTDCSLPARKLPPKKQTLNLLEALRKQKLDAGFDSMLEQMQSAEARAGMERAFNASAEQMGKAAVKAARKRG